MLTLNEIKAKIREVFDSLEDTEGWRYYIQEECYGEAETEALAEALGEPLVFYHTERDYSNYLWIFTIGDRYFSISGYYDSWNGTEMEDEWDIREIRKGQKTVEVWETVVSEEGKN
jgi:hypothetical protein